MLGLDVSLIIFSFYLVITFILSSLTHNTRFYDSSLARVFWTSRGHGCLPFSPSSLCQVVPAGGAGFSVLGSVLLIMVFGAFVHLSFVGLLPRHKADIITAVKERYMTGRTEQCTMWGFLSGPSPSHTCSPISDGLDVTVPSTATWFHPKHDTVHQIQHNVHFHV